MKVSLGSRRQLIAFGIVLAVFLAMFIRWRSVPDAATPAPSADRRNAPATGDPEGGSAGAGSRSGARRNEKTPSVQDVQFVSPADLEPLRPRGEGPAPRNIFDQRPPTPVPPPTATPAPPPPPPPGSGGFIGPLPPPPPTPTPTPPSITFKFIGTFGPKDRPFAVLVLGDQLLNARAGEVVFDNFILLRVGYESIDVGFRGFPLTETRRLGISP